MRLIDRTKLFSVENVKYAFFDGDNIGNTIENLLSNGRIAEATHLSESIKLAIFQIEIFVDSIENVEIIIAGGDDVLIKYDAQKCNLTLLKDISRIFTQRTGLSISCGVGNNIFQAIENLTNVKQQNKGKIKSSDGHEADNHSMKKTKLYIFTTSELSDPYINVLAHCDVNYENLDQVTLLSITEDRRKVNSQRDKLEKLKQNIGSQLDSLAEGKYLKKQGKEYQELEINIEPSDRKIYSKFKDIPFNIQILLYQNLEAEIQTILNTEEFVTHVFDVTAVLKSFLIDIYNILRFKKVSTIYTFELFDKRFYDDRDLIHNQTYKKTYDFVCLSESLHTQKKIIVSEDSVISESEFNHMQNDCDCLVETLITDFARLCSFVYFLILIPVFVWICWSIAQPEGWDKIEPLAFLVTFGLVLVNYLLQSLFTGKFPSWDPRELFNAAKTWRKKKLQKNRSNIRRVQS